MKFPGSVAAKMSYFGASLASASHEKATGQAEVSSIIQKS
jgi:hypothetical protein